ncbi:hypothetical protein HGRIS_002094 [Hohenbuehelia grisea]|uniref:F-box domain-containing protein n=1 Tax=Hohenbuehelia grisea TaxID=104357 RepID=A0ABR3JKS1_9AGAR
MDQLPYETWLQILSYLTTSDAENLATLNRTLFDLTLSSRYRSINIECLDTRTVRLVRHLKNDYIARHVRSFAISEWAVDQLLFREARDQRVHRSSLKSRASAQISVLKNLHWHRTSKLTRESKFIIPPESQWWSVDSPKPSYHVIEDLDHALQSLHNVDSFGFSWKSERTDMSCIRTAWRTFGPNLRTLHIHTSDKNLSMILSDAIGLTRLEDLSVSLCREGEIQHLSETGQTALLASLTSFVNQHSKSLKVISISSCLHLNLAPLFSSLDLLDQIEDIHLHLPFDENHVSDGTSLVKFLNSHRQSIRLLSLHQLACSSGCAHSRETGVEVCKRLLRDLNLPYLKSLEIALHPFIDAVDIFLLIQHVYTRLQSLRSKTSFLSLLVIKKLLSAFTQTSLSPPLRHLYLPVQSVTKELIDILASTFPSLISVEFLLPHRGAIAMINQEPFVAEMSVARADYSFWNLSNFAISYYKVNDELCYSTTSMVALANYVPSIQTFERRFNDDRLMYTCSHDMTPKYRGW